MSENKSIEEKVAEADKKQAIELAKKARARNFKWWNAKQNSSRVLQRRNSVGQNK